MSHNVVPSRYWGGEQGEFRPVWRAEATDRDKVCVRISKSSGSTARKGEIATDYFCVHLWQALFLTLLLLFWWGGSQDCHSSTATHGRVHKYMVRNLFFPVSSQPGLEPQQPCSASHDRIKFMNVFRVSHAKTHKKRDCNFTFLPSWIGLPYSRFKSHKQKWLRFNQNEPQSLGHKCTVTGWNMGC